MERQMTPDWRKSSYSSGNGGNCVEIGYATNVVLVRDTTNRDGHTLTFSTGSWRAFAARLLGAGE
jgi:Domain of unknown function (DUF397)